MNLELTKRSFDIVFNELRVLNKHTSNKIKREYAMNKRFKKIMDIKTLKKELGLTNKTMARFLT